LNSVRCDGLAEEVPTSPQRVVVDEAVRIIINRKGGVVWAAHQWWIKGTVAGLMKRPPQCQKCMRRNEPRAGRRVVNRGTSILASATTGPRLLLPV